VRDSKAAALADLKAFMAVNAMVFRTPETLAMVPEAYRDRIVEFQNRYDPTEHVVVGGRNVALMEELELEPFLSELDTTAGTVDEVAQTLRTIAAMGVSTFIAALPGHADPLAAIRGLSAARKAM
jgi:hypothetical protein